MKTSSLFRSYSRSPSSAVAWATPGVKRNLSLVCRLWRGMRRRQSGTNCGFDTLQQCRATIAGIGGWCERNPRVRRTGPRRESAAPARGLCPGRSR